MRLAGLTGVYPRRYLGWTADPDKIIAAANRGHQVLDSIHWVSEDIAASQSM
jgi:hypothetical protein